MMKTTVRYFVSWMVFLSLSLQAGLPAKRICFTENKGQVSDQHYQPRPDVQYYGSAGDMNFYLLQNGISYQFSKVDSWEKVTYDSPLMRTFRDSMVPSAINIYRLDLKWLNSNSDAVISKNGEQVGSENYYLESCPNGVLGVKRYSELIYKNIYAGIDLRWYEKNGYLKYDFQVAPGADYRQIAIEIKGASDLRITEKGNLVIETPFGSIEEDAPLVFQEGKKLNANWRIRGNVVSFDVKGVTTVSPLIIDPLVRLWGTYYGGGSEDEAWQSPIDNAGFTYLYGETKSVNNIASTGAHQISFGGAGFWGDGYVAKFDPAGNRLWATYYGGAGNDFLNYCAFDASGNVYAAGGTSATNTAVIATAGAYQTTPSGGIPGGSVTRDGFLVRFNSSGVRQWGTYFGSDGYEWAYHVYCEGSNVYICGYTTSSAGIASPGAYQTVNNGNRDGFIAKFDLAGNLAWSTYYGGPGNDDAYAVTTDAGGNVYCTGLTFSGTSTAIATPGSYQPSLGGTQDAFLVKLNAMGQRQWATYYGGSSDDAGCMIITNASGILMSGYTGSGMLMASPGCYQPNHGGGIYDGFISQFDLNGNRIWSTYYGGSGNEWWMLVSQDANGNIYVGGSTSSQNAMSSPCTYQDTYGGGSYDIFFAKFTSNGMRIWGSYYGGPLTDQGSATVNAGGRISVAGVTMGYSGAVFAGPNCHQPLYGGGNYDAILAVFDPCPPPPNTTPPTSICAGQSATLTSTLSCGTIWYNAPGGAIVGTGSSVIVAPVTTSTFYIDDISCGTGNSLTAVVVTVNPVPLLSVQIDKQVICAGTTVNLEVNGANSYTWYPVGLTGATITDIPGGNTIYSVTGSNGTCSSTSSVSVEVIAMPTISLNYINLPLCYNSSTSFTASGAQNYTWSPASLLSSTVGSAVNSYPLVQNSIFTVQASNASGSVVCQSHRIFSVSVLPEIIPTISGSHTICEGQSAFLNASGGETYFWQPAYRIDNIAEHGVLVSPLVPTVYSVEVSHNGLCAQTATILVNVVKKPKVFAGNDTTINIGDEAYLNASGEGTLRWIVGENIDCSTCHSTLIFPVNSNCYMVQAMNEFGCLAEDEVCVEIKNEYGLYIPNTFTPNGDGLNDEFNVHGFGIKERKLLIYNRWGDLLFESDDFTKGWNGYYDGKVCEIGTYVYKVKYTTIKGASMEKAGHVNIVR